MRRGARGLVYFVHQFKPVFREAALLGHLAAFPVAVEVIPTVGAKRIDQQWRAEYETHLRARHARLQFRDHFLRHGVALLNINLVRADAGQHGHLQ